MDTATFGIADVRPAVVTIDLHRGHLDTEVATLPLESGTARRVVEANIAFLDAARGRGVPVVHVVTEYRSRDEVASNPFWAAIAGTNATRGNILDHNLPGSPGTAIMPGVLEEGDAVVGMKRRYDCFLATDLEFTLRNLGANTLMITGVNTNSCVLATTIIASTKDFGCIVVEDCVDTVDGAEFHEAALKCLGRAFAWTLGSHQVFSELERAGWSPGKPLRAAAT
ncbi:MAG: cysteine hydrolase family protein [Actinomycetota bacterium]